VRRERAGGVESPPASAKSCDTPRPRQSGRTRSNDTFFATPHAMNTTQQSVPATNAAPRKTISLLQMLALIAFGGIVASLVLRLFV
jgi:hypothetical protein